jgi:S1-C subfamily serine protease
LSWGRDHAEESTLDESQPARPIPAAAARDDGLVGAVARTRDTVVSLRTQHQQGAGVVVAGSGLVLTNFHVIAEALRSPQDEGLWGTREVDAPAHRVRAIFEDGREVPAAVLVADRGEDLAVLRLRPSDEAETFAAARLGRSEELRVGEEVFAIGSPLGYQHSVSRGIVSALDRVGVVRNSAVPMLQLDASINVGNSGGPLFNLDGELVGIVTAVPRAVRGSTLPQGIAFALPIDHVRAFLRAVDEGGSKRSGVVGLWTDPDPTLGSGVTSLGYSSGVKVGRVEEGQPAHAAGIRAGDTIVEVRGRRLDAGADPGRSIAAASSFVRSVRALFPGERLPVTVVRDGKELSLEIEVAAASERRQAAIDAEELLGLRLEEGAGQPTVKHIMPGSVLGRTRGAEVLRGAEIVRVLGRDIESLDDLAPALAKVRSLVQQGRTAAIEVSIVFRRPDGRQLPLDLPVAGR